MTDFVCAPCYRGCFDECRNRRCRCLECGGRDDRLCPVCRTDDCRDRPCKAVLR